MNESWMEWVNESKHCSHKHTRTHPEAYSPQGALGPLSWGLQAEKQLMGQPVILRPWILHRLLLPVQFDAFPINKKTCRCQWTFNRVTGMGPLISQAEACGTGSSGTSLPRRWFILFVKVQFGMTVSHLLFPQMPSAQVTCSNLPSISPLLTSL